MVKVIEGEVIVREASAVALRRFFTFHQNNSGGRFDYDFFKGIGPIVIIEASGFADANRRAEDIGLYFDGLGDCECCGDRWSESWSESDGELEPEIYGNTPERYASEARRSHSVRAKCERVVFIHYATGQITAY